MLAGTVAALDVAMRRHCQMHPAIFVVIAAKTGMSLNFVFHVA